MYRIASWTSVCHASSTKYSYAILRRLEYYEELLLIVNRLAMRARFLPVKRKPNKCDKGSLQFRLRQRPTVLLLLRQRLGVQLIQHAPVHLCRGGTFQLQAVDNGSAFVSLPHSRSRKDLGTMNENHLRGRQQLIIDGERIHHQPKPPHALIARELVLPAHFVQIILDRSDHLGLIASCLDGRHIRGGNLLSQDLGGQRCKHVRLHGKDADEERLQAIAMHERQGQVIEVGEIDILQSLGGDVLALRELEHILHPIDDLESPQVIHRGYIARPEPSVGEHGFVGLLLVAVVPGKEVVAAHQELPSRLRLVGGIVFHVRHVHEAELHGGGDAAAVAHGKVAFALAEPLGEGLGEAVALDEGVADDGT